MCSPIISVRNLTKSYRLYSNNLERLKEIIFPWKKRHSLFNVLQNISFDIYRGKHLGIVGINGAGKSTLLQILTGVLTPSEGEVIVHGRVAALLELGAGFNPELTGRENVAFLTSILGVADTSTADFLNDIIEFAELDKFIDQPVKVYSSGMFARLAFAMNIAALPDILIVDEALAVGDAFFQQKCLRRMKEYRERGTILFVSHDTASVAELCDHVLWLERGRIKEYGNAKEVCEHYLASSYSKKFASPQSIHRSVSLNPKREIVNLYSGEDEKIAKDIQRHCVELRSHKSSDFAQKDSFGEGDARILRATLDNATSGSLLFTYDDICRLVIYFECFVDLSNVIVGFIFKDRLGKAIFGTNSFHYHTDWVCRAGTIYAAIFEFKMPDFVTGEYMLTLAVAEGTLETHRQLHWIYDAMSIQFSSKNNDGTTIAAKCLSCSLIGNKNDQ